METKAKNEEIIERSNFEERIPSPLMWTAPLNKGALRKTTKAGKKAPLIRELAHECATEGSSAITLVALIITIIVLLVLAGVTINMLIGENGILKNAETAKSKYENKAEQEEYDLAQADDYMINYRANGNYGEFSTDEQVIGKWINGKKMYRKVFFATTPTASTESREIIDITSLNVEVPVNLYGYIDHENGGFCPLNIYYASTDFVTTWANQTNIRMKVTSTNRQNKPCKIVLEYTKTIE